MRKLGKRLKSAYEGLDNTKRYSVEDGIEALLATPQAKFDESVDVVLSLGVDPAQSDQQVRGAVVLPHGLGKAVKVLALVKGEAEAAAKEAGADIIGSDDMIEKIQGGWLDFDKVVTTPDLMASVAKVARVLGPRGLMPNPKLGTVTPDIGVAIKNEKKGKCSFRVDKKGLVHVSIGRRSQGKESLVENYKVLMGAIVKAKPSSSKGTYVRSIYISSTQGPSVCLDPIQSQDVAV